MKMRNHILRMVSVFFLVLMLVGCGIATYRYVESSFIPIADTTTSVTTQYNVTDNEGNLSLVKTGEGPSLLLCYVVTSRASVPAFESYFKSTYQRNYNGSSVSSSDVVSYTSGSLKYTLHQFSDNNGTRYRAPGYYAVANVPTAPLLQFRLDLTDDPVDGGKKIINVTVENGSYSMKGLNSLTRYNGEAFTTQIAEITNNTTQFPDYTIEESESTLYLHIFAAASIMFNNILWSELSHLGYKQLN